MKEKIDKRLKEDYNVITSMGYETVGIFLQGSQNYKLDYEGSDIDTKAIVLPKFEDFVLRKQEASTTHVTPTNEHIDIKDIRLMFDCFKKQNINFVEILFTKYKFMNPKYEALYQPILDNAEAIARYNNYAGVNCIAGMAMEKYKALEHPYPATMDKIEKFGWDGKQLSHELRLLEFIQRYINGENYADCLISKQRDFLIGVKTNALYTLEEARIVAKETVDKVIEIKNLYMKENCVIINEEANKIMNKVLVDIIKYCFQTELGV
jgi:predicted nucleotidyltransferase